MDKYMQNSNIKYIVDTIDQNKVIVLSVITLTSLYASTYVENIADKISWFVDTSFFKFIMFIILSIIAGQNPALGVVLTIAMLVTLQVISNLNMKKEISDLTTGMILKKVNSESESESESKSEYTLESKSESELNMPQELDKEIFETDTFYVNDINDINDFTE
jgi:hypothetical protein